MGDYHILAADHRGNSHQVVAHFPVPDVLNNVGVSYRTAIVEWQGGAPIQSALPDAGVEQAQLDSGELFEVRYEFSSYPGEDLATKRGRLDALWAEKETEISSYIVAVLGYWGYERTIP